MSSQDKIPFIIFVNWSLLMKGLYDAIAMYTVQHEEFIWKEKFYNCRKIWSKTLLNISPRNVISGPALWLIMNSELAESEI